MLKIVIPAQEGWNEVKQEFVQTKEQVLVMEHSLVSLSKWESKWKKPFLTDKPKTYEETIDYMRCMTITQNIDPDVYYCATTLTTVLTTLLTTTLTTSLTTFCHKVM